MNIGKMQEKHVTPALSHFCIHTSTPGLPTLSVLFETLPILSGPAQQSFASEASTVTSWDCLPPILLSQLGFDAVVSCISVFFMVELFIAVSDWCLVSGSMKSSGHIFLSCMRPSKGLSRDQ